MSEVLPKIRLQVQIQEELREPKNLWRGVNSPIYPDLQMPLLALWAQVLSVCAVALNSISTTWHSQPMEINLPLKMTLMTSVHKSGHHWIPRAPQTWELLSFQEEEDEPEICQSFLSDHSRSTNRTDLVDSGTIYKSTGTHIHLTWFDISMNLFDCMS